MIILTVAPSACSKVCRIYKDSTRDSVATNIRDKANYPYFSDIDKKLEKGTIQFGDSTMLIAMWRNEEYLYSQQDNLLADVRQETNDMIEKITSELNFWVAILAFLGVLVPIAITHKGESETRKWLDKKEGIYDERIRTKVVDMQLKLKESTDRSSRQLTDLITWHNKAKEELDTRGKEQEELIQVLKLQREVEMMTSIRNNRFLETNSEMRKAYNEIARHLIEKFLTYLSNRLDEYAIHKERETKHILTQMSMSFFDVLTNLKLSHTDPVRPRALYLAEDSVKTLIKELLQAVPDTALLQSSFKDINRNISRVLEKL